MKRKFLTNLNIWGATLISRGGKVLHYTIPCLLKYCNKILLMMDNENEETRNIAYEYQKKYPNRIHIAETGFPRATLKQEKDPRGLFHRFKPLQGPIRQTVIDYLRNTNEKIDILIFPDSDEIFSDSLPKLLEDFWAMPDKKAITMKPVDVFGDIMTIHSRSMTGHTRVFKFAQLPDLTAVPYRTACNYRPLTKADRIGSNRVLIHLASLNTEKRNWRAKHWKPNAKNSEALWRLPREITKMTPDELREILQREPDMNIEEYLRGGDKRVPLGVENASKALKEATDLLDELGVRYFLAFGTCLGLVRDKGLIKWDWDVDLISLGEDNEKIETNVDKLTAAGFTEFKRKQDIPKWKKSETEKSEENYVRTYSFKKYGCRVDIDPAYISADGESRIILKGRKREMFCAKYPAHWFDTEITSDVEYRGKRYRIPHNVEDYLESNYGPNWNVPAYGPMPWRKRPCMNQTYECK